MNELETYLFPGLNRHDWWLALRDLIAAPEGEGEGAYRRLFSALLQSGSDSLAAAVATELLYGEPLVQARVTDTVRAALEADLEMLGRVARLQLTPPDGPRLDGLTGEAEPHVAAWSAKLTDGSADAASLLQHWQRYGRGVLARFRAFAWTSGELQGIEKFDSAGLEGLLGLERQLGRLRSAVRAWLDGRPRSDVLLYGPRGSGKSTAARGLLREFADSGLRMVEVNPGDLADLPALLSRLESSPHPFVIFVDDLGFERGDTSYRQLKTLLDGTLRAAPRNVMLIATTNRRNLIRQGFADRPDPLDEDVHAWDTQHEQLALVDRFSQVITFPPADQRRFVELVEGLARAEGKWREDIARQAIRFADRGNGYSGRTARQFVDTLS